MFFRYDQTLFEDDSKNRMMETKELFEWILKQPCFEVLSMICYKTEWYKHVFDASTDHWLISASFHAEYFFPAISQQIRFIWKEGSECKDI